MREQPLRHASGHAAQDTSAWLDVATADASDPARIQQRWMQMQYIQMDAGAFAGRFRVLRTPSTLVVNELQNRSILKQQHSPDNYCTVSLIRSVSGRGRCGLDALTAQSVGFMPGGRDYEVLLPPSEIVYFAFDQSRLQRAADAMGFDLPGGGRRPLFLDGLNTERLDSFAQALLGLQTTAGRSSLSSSDFAYLDKIVLERVLDILLEMPSDGVLSPEMGAYRLVKRASDLIEGRPDEPLTVLTLCEELHVSRGTLQRAFLQAYGISPLAFLRLRRLHGARRALQAGRSTGASVASVAMAWGFFHLSRFSQAYFLQFGELPSVTLGIKQKAREIPGLSV